MALTPTGTTLDVYFSLLTCRNNLMLFRHLRGSEIYKSRSPIRRLFAANHNVSMFLATSLQSP